MRKVIAILFVLTASTSFAGTDLLQNVEEKTGVSTDSYSNCLALKGNQYDCQGSFSELRNEIVYVLVDLVSLRNNSPIGSLEARNHTSKINKVLEGMKILAEVSISAL